MTHIFSTDNNASIKTSNTSSYPLLCGRWNIRRLMSHNGAIKAEIWGQIIANIWNVVHYYHYMHHYIHHYHYMHIDNSNSCLVNSQIWRMFLPNCFSGIVSKIKNGWDPKIKSLGKLETGNTNCKAIIPDITYWPMSNQSFLDSFIPTYILIFHISNIGVSFYWLSQT